MTFRLHFRDMPHSERVRRICASQAQSLEHEFPETSKIELTLTQDGEEHEAHVHVTGKNLDVAASATGRVQRQTIDEALERARKQIRKHHDKQIMCRRREGHRSAHSYN